MMKFLLALLLTTLVKGFAPSISARRETLLYSTAEEVSFEPKDVVRLFGRLAEKYIMLDESGGMCCYSACKDCEYRLPGGGYRMADQSAARPKWIPVYEERNFAGQNKEHKTKWSTEIFSKGPSVTKDEFIKALTEMQYAPPLGGPFVGATAAQIDDTAAAEKLFDILSGEKEKLARFKMSVQLKELAKGEQGLAWKDFAAAMGV